MMNKQYQQYDSDGSDQFDSIQELNREQQQQQFSQQSQQQQQQLDLQQKRQQVDRKKRINIACDNCHRRKTRCLGGHPCPTCSKRNIECIYSGESRKRKERQSQPPQRQPAHRDPDMKSPNVVYSKQDRLPQNAPVPQRTLPQLKAPDAQVLNSMNQQPQPGVLNANAMMQNQAFLPKAPLMTGSLPPVNVADQSGASPLNFSLEFQSELIDYYYQHLWSEVPIICRSLFVAAFNHYSTTHHVLCLSLYALVCHHALAAQSLPFVTPEMASQYFMQAMQMSAAVSFQQNSLHEIWRIQSLQLISMTHSMRGSLTLASRYLEEAIESSRRLNLNYSLFNCKNIVLTETSRRTWWLCYILDRLYAAVGKRAVIIADHESSVELPDSDLVMLSEYNTAQALPEITLQTYQQADVGYSDFCSQVIAAHNLGKLMESVQVSSYQPFYDQTRCNSVRQDSEEVLKKTDLSQTCDSVLAHLLVELISYCPQALTLDLNEVAKTHPSDLDFALQLSNEIDQQVNQLGLCTVVAGLAVFYSSLIRISFICMTDNMMLSMDVKNRFDNSLAVLEGISNVWCLLLRFFKALVNLCQRPDVKERLLMIEEAEHVAQREQSYSLTTAPQIGSLTEEDIDKLASSLSDDFDVNYRSLGAGQSMNQSVVGNYPQPFNKRALMQYGRASDPSAGVGLDKYQEMRFVDLLKQRQSDYCKIQNLR
ncbi:hypothetical protein MP228_008143 [Amoeboaphelidium protococcarum]|nr:hypothetical protein MP228_008143 [Amoeboaphelidium protococcarum]